MIEDLKKQADLEAKRQGVRFVIVSIDGKMIIQRYDWFCDGLQKESRYIRYHKGKNVFANAKIEYFSQ